MNSECKDALTFIFLYNTHEDIHREKEKGQTWGSSQSITSTPVRDGFLIYRPQIAERQSEHRWNLNSERFTDDIPLNSSSDLLTFLFFPLLSTRDYKYREQPRSNNLAGPVDNIEPGTQLVLLLSHPKWWRSNVVGTVEMPLNNSPRVLTFLWAGSFLDWVILSTLVHM